MYKQKLYVKDIKVGSFEVGFPEKWPFFLGERLEPALPPNSPYKIAPPGQPAIVTHLLRLNVHFHFFIIRWECPMICTTSSTTCGWRTSPLGSSLDKHMPWISGHQHLHLLTSCSNTRRTTQTPQMSCLAQHQPEISPFWRKKSNVL